MIKHRTTSVLFWVEGKIISALSLMAIGGIVVPIVLNILLVLTIIMAVMYTGVEVWFIPEHQPHMLDRLESSINDDKFGMTFVSLLVTACFSVFAGVLLDYWNTAHTERFKLWAKRNEGLQS